MQPDKLALVSTNASPEQLDATRLEMRCSERTTEIENVSNPSAQSTILRNFAATIGRKRYEHWFQQQTQVWIEGDELVVAVATPFLVNWMSQNFRAGLLAAARPVIGDGVNIRFEVRTAGPSEVVGQLAAPVQGLSPSNTQMLRVDSGASVVSVSHEQDRPLVRRVVPDRVTASVGASLPGDRSADDDVRPSKPVANVSRESLRRKCRDSHSANEPPQPMSLKLAVAAATAAAQAAIPATATLSQSSRNTPVAADCGLQRTANARQIPEKPKIGIEPKVLPQIPADKPSGDKPVSSVARVTRDSPLTLAKVKPIEEPPRNQRRYADLMDLVEGTCNEFALSAARQVCQAPGAQFTSLFVHGPVGVGKTHVLEGIHRELKQRFPSRQVVYLTAEAFANFFTQALRDHKLPSFRQKFRSIDVLIVDDIDFLDGKRGIQEEFLFTVQQLEAHGRVIVVAAHGHPRLLTKMSDELRTRFLAGMVCRIDAPDVATRRRIVENKAFRAGADFAPDVFQFVADRFRNNVRELEGAFNTLLAHQRMGGRRLSLTAARHALADLERDCIRVVRMVDIEQAVCSLFGITTEDLKSGKRQQSISQPRMLAMYLARKHTRAAYTEIGQHFGGRNHSTVMAAEKKIRTSLTEEEPMLIRTQAWRVSDLIETLEQQLQAG